MKLRRIFRIIESCFAVVAIGCITMKQMGFIGSWGNTLIPAWVNITIMLTEKHVFPE